MATKIAPECWTTALLRAFNSLGCLVMARYRPFRLLAVSIHHCGSYRRAPIDRDAALARLTNVPQAFVVIPAKLPQSLTYSFTAVDY
jgi:hypothetical protein